MLKESNRKRIKCVVWDLDDTIWTGTLLEGDKVVLKPHIRSVIEVLDKRGILQSIASRNDYNLAMEKIEEFGLKEYFLYPQIGWNSKSSSIQKIKDSLNIPMDSIAFVDDQSFEREEINFVFPEVLCFDGNESQNLLEYPELMPRFITRDSLTRRQMYMDDTKRKDAESQFEGVQEEFLANLDMKLTINLADDQDLKRIEELTVRTHQLNSTGYTYSYEELDQFRKMDTYKLYVAELEDRYGTYGKIGVVLIECKKEVWRIKLLLMSCRVMNRGVGSAVLNFVKELVARENVKLQAEFVETDRNRMMYITYRFAGFKEVSCKEGLTILEAAFEDKCSYPEYMELITP